MTATRPREPPDATHSGTRIPAGPPTVSEHSVRVRAGAVTRAERAAAGKLARRVVPLVDHAEIGPGRRRDPVDLLETQAASRIPQLVPIRYGRMLATPFTFYRGAALLMAADLGALPTRV